MRHIFNRQWLTGAIIFGLALSLKVVFFAGHQYFSQDQVRDYLLIRRHWQEHNFYIPLGPTTASDTNLATLPGYYYLQLVAQGLSGQSFHAMTVLIMIIESFTPVILYFYVYRLIKPLTNQTRASLISGLVTCLYMTSPLVIQASTSNWNPHLVPFFALVMLVASQQFIFDHRQNSLMICLLAFLALVNLHFQWFVLVPLLLVVLGVAVCRWRDCWRSLTITLLVGGLVISPYLYFELTHKAENFRHGWQMLTAPAQPVTERLRKPIYYTLFFPGFYTRVFTGQLYFSNWEYLYLPDWTLTTYVWLPSLLLGVIFGTVWLISTRTPWPTARQLLWPTLNFTIMMFVLRAYHGDKPDYYLYCFLPYVFVWLAIVATRIKSRWLMGLGWLVLWGHELVALSQIPPVNVYRDWQQLVARFPDGDYNLVILNQNLFVPLTFFVNESQIKSQLDPTARYNLLLCDAYQWCDRFLPNYNSPHNIYRYDLVTPTDYSVILPHYDPAASRVYRNQSLKLHILVQDI